MKNINVGVKLGLGFALVLGLALVLALSNSLNLGKVVVQSDNIYEASKIVSYAQSLEEASLHYQVETQDKWIDELSANVRKIQETSTRIAAAFVNEENRQQVREVGALAPKHEEGFLLMVEQERNMEALVDDLFSRRNLVLPVAEQLYRELNGEPDRPQMYENYASAITAQRTARMVMQLGDVFFYARAYLMDIEELRLDRLEQAYEAFLQTRTQLARSLNEARYEQNLAAIEAGMVEYMELVRQVPDMEKKRLAAKDIQFDVAQELRSRIDQVMTGLNEVRNDTSRIAGLTGWAVAAVALLVGTLIGFLITRQITGPLQTAVGIAQALGQRDMTGQGVEQRRDEFGVLLNALDQTRGNLRGALTEVSGFTTQLAAAAEELSVVTSQTSTGVHNQRTETEQVATAMNEMAATVQEVAQNSEEAAGAANRADEQAKSGNAVLGTALSEISKLTDEVHRSSEAIQQLNRDSESINAVLTVINEIAEQTNLLALNAAIEAARAGEAGRGFAVVADEVRGLAHRTQESTSQIESLISNLQQGSGNAVQMMEAGDVLADATLELTREAGQELEAIVRTVAEIQAMNIQIATAAEEQSLVAEEINRSVINVNNIADQSAAAVEETSASSAELARLGQELQTLVGQFKI